MRLLAAFLLTLAASSAVHAGTATGVYEDPSGDYRIVVTLHDPLGPIGLEHFDAISFTTRAPSGSLSNEGVAPNTILLALTPDSKASLPAREAVKVRRARSDETGEWHIDWSGVEAKIESPLISSCTSGLAGEFFGLVSLGQSFVVTVYTAMSQLSVLSTLNRKGDADLYVYDSQLNLVCSSTLPTSGKIADQCGFLSSICNQQATSYTEVYGYKKKNIFHIAVWFSNAI